MQWRLAKRGHPGTGRGTSLPAPETVTARGEVGLCVILKPSITRVLTLVINFNS